MRQFFRYIKRYFTHCTILQIAKGTNVGVEDGKWYRAIANFKKIDGDMVIDSVYIVKDENANNGESNE